MTSLFTLPAESYVQTNGSPVRTSLASHPLAGNIIWAVGHLPDSNKHTLHCFDGIKGGTLQWHTFLAPREAAEEVELELALEGSLGLRMDRELFLGTVRSVTESAISWTRAGVACRDFQMGRDYFCHRNTDSDTFILTQIEHLDSARDLPPPPSPPDCYCLSSRDDLFLLSGLVVLVLSPPYSHWTRIETALPARTFLSLFAPKVPIPSKLCVSRNHLCALSQDGQTLSLLSMVPSPTWQQLSLVSPARQICPVSGATLSFLVLDQHFLLSHAHLDTGSLRPIDLLPAFLPHREVLSSVRAIRSIFDNNSDSLSPMLSPISPCSSAPPLDSFFTAAPSDPLDMELDPAVLPPTADPLPFDSNHSSVDFKAIQSNELPFQTSQPLDSPFTVPTADPSYYVPTADPSYSVPTADPSYSVPTADPSYSVPTADPSYSVPTADPSYSVPTADPSYSDPAVDWLLSEAVFSNTDSEAKTGSKRLTYSEYNSSHKHLKSDHPHTDGSFHTGTYLPEVTTPRSSEERRTDKRFLRDRTPPCPMPPYSFVPIAHNVSHFEDLLQEAQIHAGTNTPIQEVQGLLFDQEFDFSLAREEKNNLARLFPKSPPSRESPPPPSAPPTVPIPHFQL